MSLLQIKCWIYTIRMLNRIFYGLTRSTDPAFTRGVEKWMGDNYILDELEAEELARSKG